MLNINKCIAKCGYKAHIDLSFLIKAYPSMNWAKGRVQGIQVASLS